MIFRLIERRLEAVVSNGVRENSGLQGYDEAQLLEGFTRVVASTARSEVLEPLKGFSAAILEEGINHYDVPPVGDHVIFMTQKVRPNVETDFLGKRRRINVPQRALTLIPARTPSLWTHDEPGGKILHMHFRPSEMAAWLHEDEAKLGLRPTLNASDHQIRHCADLLMREMLEPGPAGALMIEALALQIAALVRRNYGTDISPTLAKGGLAPWQLRQTTEYLNDHLGEEIMIETLARNAGLSKYHFMRAFRQSTGTTVLQTLIDRRIGKARDLLENTKLPVSEVAARVGYRAPQAFAKVFRRETGAAPADYRRERGIQVSKNGAQ